MDGSIEFINIEKGVQSLIGPDELVVGTFTRRRLMREPGSLAIYRGLRRFAVVTSQAFDW